MSNSTLLQPKGRVPSAPQPERLQPRPSRRREKPQLSCSSCRSRKLKCDREQPCQNCSRRSCPCHYPVTSHAPQKLKQDYSQLSQPLSFYDRVSEVERLLTSRINRSNASNHGANQASRAIYDEGTQWSAILEKVGELKTHFGDLNASIQVPVKEVLEFDGPELLSGRYKRITKQECLAALPPRPLVDKMVVKCFDSVDIAPVIIHRLTFMKQYELFWDKPQETPIMWMGLLFAMMCVATQYEQLPSNGSAATFHGLSTPEVKHLISAYREKTVQCLVLGNYLKAPPNTIETLLLYFHSEYVFKEDSESGSWILLGIIVRLALRMGYHVDGCHFPDISPFQAEMRRRAWAVISTLDIFPSVQLGLPKMIKDSEGDSEQPRNLLEEDLDENMTVLPNARPDTLQTAVLYFEARNRIIRILGRAFDLTTCTPPCSYDEVMALDGALNSTYDAIPHWLAMPLIAQSNTDSPEQSMRRIYIRLVFLSARCMLHRKLMLQAESHANFTYSRVTCIEASIQTLQIQRELDRETQIGGRLYQDRWKVGSIFKNEFLLATTILCLDLDCGLSSEEGGHSSNLMEREEVLKNLKESYYIWLRSSGSSPEAQKAVEVLQIVLEKAPKLAAQTVERPLTDDSDESILHRPKPINFMPSDRYFRGPMVLPPMDEGRPGDGDVTLARRYRMENWKDILGSTSKFPLTFYFPLSDGRKDRP